MVPLLSVKSGTEGAESVMLAAAWREPQRGWILRNPEIPHFQLWDKKLCSRFGSEDLI